MRCATNQCVYDAALRRCPFVTGQSKSLDTCRNKTKCEVCIKPRSRLCQVVDAEAIVSVECDEILGRRQAYAIVPGSRNAAIRRAHDARVRVLDRGQKLAGEQICR